jgi:hypothetical protein
MPHRSPNAAKFLAVAVTSENLRPERSRHGAPLAVTSRSAHTSHIDAEWDLPAEGQVEHEARTISGVEGLRAAAPRTSPIDAEWASGPYGDVAFQAGGQRLATLAPRTSLIDAEWDALLSDDSKAPDQASRLGPRQLALLDANEELDPVITYFELDGPECLGLADDEL